ncbi:MAG: leucine-rich repeat domain-containing protein [Lachnospiraceae bacterium]|nr:leucine-rich repeat domain-containing protein [Lachnospiraceae bacterium]
MRIKERIISFIMSLVMIITLMPIPGNSVQAASNVIEKSIVEGEELTINAEDLGVAYNPIDYSITYFWKIKKGDTDYTEDETLIKLAQDKVTILDVDGNCVLDGATVSLSYKLTPGGVAEASKQVLLHATHTPKMMESGDTWVVGETQHYQVCADCNTEYGYSDHTSGEKWIVDKEATEEENGSKHKECTVCGGVTETEEIPKLACTHTIFLPTWNYNAEVHSRSCLCGITSAYVGEHTAGDWILDSTATAEEDGKRHKECTVCGYEMEEETISYEDSVIKTISVTGVEIPKAGQDYTDVENKSEDLTYGGAYVMDYIKYEVYDEETEKWKELGDDEKLAVSTDYRMKIGLLAETGYTYDTTVSNITVSVNGLPGTLKEVTDENTYAVIYCPFTYACVHDFTDKIESDEYLVPGSGSDCTDPYEYYFACDVCGEKSSELTWESKVHGAHDLNEENYCDTCDATIYNIWVGSKEITSKNAADVCGDETVSYNPETNVLTLNGYCKEGEVHEFEDDYYAAIYSEGDLNLELKGENYITESEDSEVPVYGLMSFDGDVTISGGGLLKVSTTRMIFAPNGGVTIRGGNIELNGAGTGIAGLTVEIAGGYTAIAGQDICVLVGNEGETLKLTGGSLDMYAYSPGDFIYNASDRERKALDLSNYHGYIARAVVPTIGGPRYVTYDPENIEDYVELSFEKIPDDMALTSVEIGNVIFPKAGELVDDIESPWDTATYGGNYEICELGWYFENAEGEMEGIDYDVPMEEGKEYYLHLTVETPYESGFPTDLDREKITVNGIKAQDITIVYGPQYLSFNIPFYPEHVHGFADVWQKDAANHWKACKCGEKSGVTAHTFGEGVVTTQPTATEEGVKTYTCTVCKATKTEAVPVIEQNENVDTNPPMDDNASKGDADEVTNVPAKNTILKDEKNGVQYKVITSSATNGTVEFTKPKDKKVKKVVVPDTVTINGITYRVTSIAKNAFNGFKRLEKVTIGKNVTTIGDKAFYKCTKLTKITIPSKVNKIGKQAFYGCKKLKTITIKTTKLTSKKVGNKAFKGTPKNAKVKVPSKSLKSYKKFLYKKGLNKRAKIKK